MAGFGIVSAGLLIARMMCKIAIGVEVPQTRQEKMRAMAVELAIGLGPPLVQLIICKVFVMPRSLIFAHPWTFSLFYSGPSIRDI